MIINQHFNDAVSNERDYPYVIGIEHYCQYSFKKYRFILGTETNFSLNDQVYIDLVKAVREAENAVGEISYELMDKKIKGRAFSRSLYVVKDIKVGKMITVENVNSKRPSLGMHLR